MITSELVKELQRRGVQFQVIDGRVKISAPEKLLTPEITQQLREHKTLLLSLLQKTDWKELYEERAAIFEHEAGIPQWMAERAARLEVLNDYIASEHPVIMETFDAEINQSRVH